MIDNAARVCLPRRLTWTTAGKIENIVMIYVSRLRSDSPMTSLMLEKRGGVEGGGGGEGRSRDGVREVRSDVHF